MNLNLLCFMIRWYRRSKFVGTPSLRTKKVTGLY